MVGYLVCLVSVDLHENGGERIGKSRMISAMEG